MAYEGKFENLAIEGNGTGNRMVPFIAPPKVTQSHQRSPNIKNEIVHDRSNDLPNGSKFHEKSNEPIFRITRGQTILIYIYDAIIDVNAVACYRIRFGYNLITKTSAEYGKKLYIYAAEVVVIKLSTKCMLQH